jgi:hypothetical protein
MRSIEVTIVIFIIASAFILASFFAVLPSPREVSPINLRQLALTTLQMLDAKGDLSATVFKDVSDSAWGELQIALAASLPPNVAYNLTVYEVRPNESGRFIYVPVKSLSNAEGSLGVGSNFASYLMTSSNVTFRVVPEKIGERIGGGTLYILNCSDAYGWWITGYTPFSLAMDVARMLSAYFQTTIFIQNTTQLGQLLNGTSIQGEPVQHAVIVNTVGEAVPIPQGYYMTEGYDSGSYAKYCWLLGQRVRQYNWTWVSIVGYPLYYVSNTQAFPTSQNGYGIYGMMRVGAAGLNAFLQGIDNQPYTYNSQWITGSPGVVYMTDEAREDSNYYGIYPSEYQTATRALPSWIQSTYHVTATAYLYEPVGQWIPAATFKHQTSGALVAIGFTRPPDIRVTGLALLSYYHPRIYREEFKATNTSRLVVLQLALMGG